MTWLAIKRNGDRVIKAPSPPAPPDPYKVSAADQAGNTGTAIAQTWMKNANERSPLGNVDYNRTGTQFTKDALGNPLEIPTFTRTTTLSPSEQANYDLEQRVGQRAGGIAEEQLGRLQTSLGKPIEYDRLSNDNYGAYRDRAEGALRQRLSPELDRQRTAHDAALFNQGVRPGSEAYREAQALADRQRNDADLAIISGAGGEVDRAFGMDQSRTAFNNQAAAAERNQPINEISALMGQTQVNMPQFQQYQSGTIAPTSVGDNIWKEHAAKMQNYQAQLQAKQAQMGGLFSLGSSLVRLPFMGM